MKKIFSYILVIILLSFSLVALSENTLLSYASTSNNEKIACDAKLSDAFSDERILVVLNDEASSSSKKYSKSDFNVQRCESVRDLTSYKTSIEYQNKKGNKFRRVLSLELTSGSKEYVLETIKELIKRDDVLYAGPDYEISAASTTANDYYADTQWAIESLQLPKVWDFSTGSNDIIVGVIDSGIDGTHPDLQDSIVNELCRDFTSGVEVATPNPTDLYGHGTHVAGIIGATTNNGVGVAGTNWNVGLVSLKIFDEAGNGSTSYVAEAISFAERTGIPILNLSASWNSTTPGYDVALNAVIANYSGVIVCAAGNWGADNDGNDPGRPASYPYDNIISVGAIDENGERWVRDDDYYSNYGANTVDIYAPGSNIVSTYPASCYLPGSAGHIAMGYFSDGGTSMATPFVTGVSALLLSINSYLSVAQIKNAIINSAESINITIPDGSTQNVKKLNAYNAVKYVLSGYSETIRLDYNTKSLGWDVDSSSTFFDRKNFFVNLDVDNSFEYNFTVSSSSPLQITLYDSNFNEMDLVVTQTNGGATNSFVQYLAEGSYYLNANFTSENVSGEITTTIVGEHRHNPLLWMYLNSSFHRGRCSCGEWIQRAHVINASQVVNFKAPCLECLALLDLREDSVGGQMGIGKESANGSYILPNGVIVLVEEDVDAYFAGTLIFYDGDSNLLTQ